MRKKLLKKLLWLTTILIILGNVAVFNHAWRFTHFVDSEKEKTRKPEVLGFFDKAKIAFTGITVPKPTNNQRPETHFTTHHIQGDELLEAWHIGIPNSKGLILMFHGYASSKSGLLPTGV
ncbi:MAG: hypothetical protein R3B47_07020 [Bacteroidia bacterium]